MVIAESITGPVDPATTLQAILSNATRLGFRRAKRIDDAAFCAEGKSDHLHCLDWLSKTEWTRTVLVLLRLTTWPKRKCFEHRIFPQMDRKHF